MRLLIILLLLPGVVNAATHYISTTGRDYTDCTGGTESNPWLTWKVPETNNCIAPGDTVYLKEGTYSASGDTFNSGILVIHGKPGKEIILAPDPAASATEGSWPVKLNGQLEIQGEYAVIEGIENDGADNGLKIFASHFTLKDSYIHSATKDCIRVLQTHYPVGDHNTNINIINNKIKDCGEDAIDSTGAINIVYRGNDISDFETMQIKGGSENVLIENNTIHDSVSSLVGNSMTCGYYCGSPVLPKLPVQDRYVAKNVTIRNNVIYNLTSYAAIKPNGWIDSKIYNNTLYDLGTWVLYFSANSGLDYYDSTARIYCNANPGKCSSCGSGCYTIKHHPHDIEIRNNILSDNQKMVYLDSDIYPLKNIKFSNNIYYNNDEIITFEENGSTRNSLADFTLESNTSYEQDPKFIDPKNRDFSPRADSIVRDNGSLYLFPEEDYSGRLRDSIPDIGAIEYTSTPNAPPVQSFLRVY